MPTPIVPLTQVYTPTNGTPADATKVQQDLTQIYAALNQLIGLGGDGTSIEALLTAGGQFQVVGVAGNPVFIATYAGAGLFTNPVSAQSDGLHPGFVIPAYTPAGAETASTLHAVLSPTGGLSGAAGSIVVNLVGAAQFDNSASYVVLANSPFGNNPVTHNSGSQFTITSTGAFQYSFIAIGV